MALSFTEMGTREGDEFGKFSHVKSERQLDIQVGSRIYRSGCRGQI